MGVPWPSFILLLTHPHWAHCCPRTSSLRATHLLTWPCQPLFCHLSLPTSTRQARRGRRKKFLTPPHGRGIAPPALATAHGSNAAASLPPPAATTVAAATLSLEPVLPAFLLACLCHRCDLPVLPRLPCLCLPAGCLPISCAAVWPLLQHAVLLSCLTTYFSSSPAILLFSISSSLSLLALLLSHYFLSSLGIFCSGIAVCIVLHSSFL